MPFGRVRTHSFVSSSEAASTTFIQSLQVLRPSNGPLVAAFLGGGTETEVPKVQKVRPLCKAWLAPFAPFVFGRVLAR